MEKIIITISYKHDVRDIIEFINKYFPEIANRFLSSLKLSAYTYEIIFKDLKE